MRERTLFIVIGALLCAGVVFLVLGVRGLIPVGSILVQLTYILSLSLIILFALLGAYFFGMITTHTILKERSFTPFERSMLEMGEDVKKLVKETEELKKRMEELEKKE